MPHDRFYMPEGPSLVTLRELAQPFKGLRVVDAQGNSKIDKTRLIGQKIIANAARCSMGRVMPDLSKQSPLKQNS